jgi:hypothetical protein
MGDCAVCTAFLHETYALCLDASVVKKNAQRQITIETGENERRGSKGQRKITKKCVCSYFTSDYNDHYVNSV